MCRLLLGMAITSLAVLTAGWANASDVEDNAVAHRIASNLKTSGQMEDYQIGVTCKNRVTWLSGEVTNPKQRATALVIARTTPGVVQVIDNLSVKSQASSASSAEPKPSLVRNISSKLEATLAGGTSNARRPRPQAKTPSQSTPRQTASSSSASGIRTVAVSDEVDPNARRGVRHISQQGQPPQPRRPVRQAQLPGNGGQYGPPQAAAAGYAPGQGGVAPVRHDNPNLPAYAWPSYASHPNYAGLTYPKQYSPTAWPYIGPFYPYPQVPLGWRKVTLEWDDGWWWLDFNN